MRQVDIVGLRFGMLVVNKKVSGSVFTGASMSLSAK
jgi:hypothetical protein